MLSAFKTSHHANLKPLETHFCKTGYWGFALAFIFEPRHEKTNILVSNQVQHKPGCTATEDG